MIAPITIEYNELIAEFMGLIRKEPTKEYNEIRYLKRQGTSFKFIGYIHQLEYHKSWDWLMPVIDTIENHDFSIDIGIDYCSIRPKYNSWAFGWDGVLIYSSDKKYSRIEASHKAIIEFIKWYNQNKS